MYPIRTLAKKMKTALRNPNAVPDAILRTLSETNRRLAYWYHGVQFYPDGVDIFTEDWDNLIILDACRYDEFERACEFDGVLESRLSRGSMSEEFVRGNFSGQSATDTVYVSSNLWYAKLHDEIDATIHEFMPVERDAFNGETSHPATVTAAARDANERYPNKRLIIHYLQPHQPYFDDEGEKFRLGARFPRDLRNQPHNRDDIIKAYRDTLALTLSSVEELLNDLTGQTVITADHGELFGSRARPLPVRRYGHPRGTYVKPLLKVPWFIVESNQRKEIADGCRSNTIAVNDATVDNQLEALGYKI
ncbi:hypothetical protein SG26_03155 [Haloarcula sp. CBA1115]|nr:hypothetical protein SG26_03155 [Haloarcula sp. CBA1115]